MHNPKPSTINIQKMTQITRSQDVGWLATPTRVVLLTLAVVTFVTSQKVTLQIACVSSLTFWKVEQ